MTDIEATKILAVLKAAYPASYNKQSGEEISAIINLWAEMLDEPYELVGAAVKSYIATDVTGFPPSIGQVKAHINRITQPDQMTEGEAIGLILKATRNSAYHSTEEFNKLPPMLQKLVGTPAQLRAWALCDSDTVNTVVSSNLQRSYKVLIEREREIKALPEAVKKVMRLSANSGITLIE